MYRKIIAALLVCIQLICAVWILPGCQAEPVPGTSQNSTQVSLPSSGSTGASSSQIPTSTGGTIPTQPTEPSTLPPETTVPSTAPTVPATTAPTVPATTAPTEPALPVWLRPDYSLKADYGFVYDSSTQEYLYQTADPNTRVYPASLTKLFTSYVALQYLSPDTVVTVGEEVTYIHPESSRAYIQEGHQLTVSMLIEGMMLPSGNDAAYALAAATGYVLADQAQVTPAEAITLFMQEVNAQAQVLGLTGTHFSTPDGIHQDDHYTTPADLLTIAQLAMDTPLIRQYAATASDTVQFASGQWRGWNNSNALLHPDSEYYCPEAIGLKTGSEDLAGYCLIAAFPTPEGLRYVLVLKSDTGKSRFEDTLWLYHNIAKTAASYVEAAVSLFPIDQILPMRVFFQKLLYICQSGCVGRGDPELVLPILEQ